MNIHILQQSHNIVMLPNKDWETGWWNIDENKAKELVGGEIYFHDKQQEPSFFGGNITGYRIEQDVQNQGRIVFRLRYNATCRNVKTEKHGWAKKMKIISNA